MSSLEGPSDPAKQNSGELEQENNAIGDENAGLDMSKYPGAVPIHNQVLPLGTTDPETNERNIAIIKEGYLLRGIYETTTTTTTVPASGNSGGGSNGSQPPSEPGEGEEGVPYLVSVPEMVNIELQPTHNRMVNIPLTKPAGDRGMDGDDDGYDKDPERDAPLKNIVFAQGYPSTAAIMSTDAELSVYRRFDRLQTRNLLYYQAELMYLEKKMDQLDEEDRLLDTPADKRHLRHFQDLIEADYDNERVNKRKDLMYEMRNVLSQYNEAMYYYKEMINNPEPSNRVVTSIRNWKANQGDPPIIDISEQAYDETYEADLMALKPPKCDDRVSIFVQDNLGRFFKKPKPDHIPDSENVLYYSETAIDFFVTVICTLLAIIVLVGSMTTLFFIESAGVRLGLVWVFTFLFAISIFLMANLNKGEIFLATAAYCAILVVYISSG